MSTLRNNLSVTRTKGSRWLLDLTFAGSTYYLTDGVPVDVDTDSGGTIRYRSGLAPLEVSEEIELFSESASTRSVSVEITLVDVVAELVSKGHHVSAATGTLAQHYDGQTHEQRRIVLVGRLVEPIYGSAYEPLSASLEESPFDDQNVVPPWDAIASVGVAWVAASHAGTVVEGVQGAVYPVIIGRPGNGGWGEFSADYTRGSPALLVVRDSGTASNNRIVIAGHPVSASTVYVWNGNDSTKNFTASPETITDGVGRVVSYVAPASDLDVPEDGDALWVGWGYGLEGTGGMQNPFGEGMLRAAGDVCRWALTSSSVRVDAGQLANLTKINAFKIDTHINDHISPLEWFQTRLAPLLPISAITGPQGLYYAVLDFDAQPKDALAWIGPEYGCSRESVIEESSAYDVCNEFKIEFNPRVDTNAFLQYRILTARRNVNDPWSLESSWCKRSQALFGKRTMALQAPDIADPETAIQILNFHARRYCFPVKSVWYSVPRSYDHLMPGDVVAVTDDDVYLSDRVAFVGAKTYSDAGQVMVQLRIFQAHESAKI